MNGAYMRAAARSWRVQRRIAAGGQCNTIPFSLICLYGVKKYCMIKKTNG